MENRIDGKCSCGEKFIKIENSNHPTMWENGDRYVYQSLPNHLGCVFRCGTCMKPIHETFNKTV
jgi:hypothetical protein